MQTSNQSRWADAVVAAVIIVGAVLRPWIDDDGWVKLTIEHARETGRYSYVIVANDAPYTLLKPWFWLLDHLYMPELTPWHFLVRLPSVVLILLTWWLVRRMLRALECQRPAAILLAGCFFASASLTLSLSLRPEAAYCAALALAGLAGLRWLRDRDLRLLLWSLPVAAAAASLHPNGVLAGTALFIALLVRRPQRPFLVLGVAAASAALALPLVLWDLGPAEFWAALVAIKADPSHSAGIVDEWKRWILLLRYDPPLALVMLALIPWSVIALARRWRTRPEVVAALFLLVATLAWFAVSPSKWKWYYAALTPLLTVGIAVAAQRLRTVPVLAALAVATTLAHAASWMAPVVSAPSLYRTAFLGEPPDPALVRLVAGREVMMQMSLFPYLRPARLFPFDERVRLPDLAIDTPGFYCVRTFLAGATVASVTDFDYERFRWRVVTVAGPRAEDGVVRGLERLSRGDGADGKL